MNAQIVDDQEDLAVRVADEALQEAQKDRGVERAAAFYTLIRSAKLNGIEPESWLTDVIARIGAHPINRLAELLAWNLRPAATP